MSSVDIHLTPLGEAVFTIGFIVIVIAALVIAICLRVFSKTKRGKGILGERLVRRRLKSYFGKNALVFNNFIYVDDNYVNQFLPKDKKSTQIDHIVVSAKGVLVIETKNYSGKIYGSSTSNEWVQYLGGQNKRRIHNPVKQNATHCVYVRKIIGENIPIYSIVILVKNNKGPLSWSDRVVRLSELKDYLDCLTEVLSEEQISDVVERLTEARATGLFLSLKHRRNVKGRRKDLSRGICPRCGGHLVFHNGSFGDYFGCKNYPTCTYKKRVK